MQKKLSLHHLLLLATLPLCSFAQITSESESNNTLATADGPMGSGVAVSGNISSTTDADWFTFNTGGAGSITVSLSHANRRNFDIYLYKSTGGAVASSTSTANSSSLTYSATAAEAYFVEVRRVSGTGSYTVTASFPGGSNPTPTPTPTATPTPTPTPGGDLGPRPAKPGGFKNYLTGNTADSGKTPVNGPAILLMGGNFEVDSAFANRAYPINNGGDIVVLRTSGTNGYNDYLYNLVSGSLQPDSVETIIVDTVSKANSDYVDWVIKTAEMIHIAGGDQAVYLNTWKDTKVESALTYAYNRGAVISGLSAGTAVLGEYQYDPDGVLGIYSSEAASNICHPNMVISNGFLEVPLLQNLISDSHFSQRNRMGRLMSFIAYINNPALAPTEDNITGIGVDEDTSLFIDRNGMATADGSFGVYILRKNAGTTYDRISCGQTLKITNMSRTKLTAGQTFNLNTGSTTGTTTNISIDGGSCTYSFTQEANCFYSPANVY